MKGILKSLLPIRSQRQKLKLINICYLQYWFLKNEQDIMFKTFSYFSEYTFKIQ